MKNFDLDEWIAEQPIDTSKSYADITQAALRKGYAKGVMQGREQASEEVLLEMKEWCGTTNYGRSLSGTEYLNGETYRADTLYDYMRHFLTTKEKWKWKIA